MQTDLSVCVASNEIEENCHKYAAVADIQAAERVGFDAARVDSIHPGQHEKLRATFALPNVHPSERSKAPCRSSVCGG